LQLAAFHGNIIYAALKLLALTHMWDVLQVHFAALNKQGYSVAFKTAISYSTGMAKWLSKMPGLKGLTAGSTVDVGFILERSNQGEWELTIKAFADVNGQSFGDLLIYSCTSFEVLFTGRC
jgi:hypothetical protein